MMVDASPPLEYFEIGDDGEAGVFVVVVVDDVGDDDDVVVVAAAVAVVLDGGDGVVLAVGQVPVRVAAGPLEW